MHPTKAVIKPSIFAADAWSAYIEMTKPKVVLMMLITVWVGMVLTPVVQLPWFKVIYGLLGIAALSAAGAVFNHILDENIDRKMQRTSRPLP